MDTQIGKDRSSFLSSRHPNNKGYLSINRGASSNSYDKQRFMTGWTFFCPLMIVCLCLLFPLVLINNCHGSLFLDPNESRVLPINTILTTGIKVHDPAMKLITFRFASLPPLNQMLFSNYAYNLQVAQNSYHYYAYYLNPGSSVAVKFSSQEGIFLYVIKGDAVWNSSKDKLVITQGDSYEAEAYSQGGTQQVLSFSNGLHADNYYFVLSNTDADSPAGVSIQLALQQTLYDISGATQACTAVLECELLFSPGSAEVVIVQAPDDISQEIYPLDFQGIIN